MNHEENIYKILSDWKTPVATDESDQKIMAAFHNRAGQKKFTWAWAAMIIVIVVNIFVVTRLVNETREYKSTMYSNYIETTQQSLIPGEINS